jgi:uncharacterized membrane protein YccC
MQANAATPRLDRNMTDALIAAGEPLFFGVRMWASVCFALFVAFWLELDNPFWAGASAAAVCQPQLGASLQKGWFRAIGTGVGAVVSVVLAAWFPQDPVGFLGFLALWGGICAFVATALRNFASYAAALAGYTAVIIAADNLGATGGASPDIFVLAITRASEICIGIVCGGIVLAGTDLGGAERRLALSFAALANEISGQFFRVLNAAGRQPSESQNERRDLVRRVVLLDPMVDQVFGESTWARYHAPTLERAVYGLFSALDGWRAVATHLSELPRDVDRQMLQAIRHSIPPELRSGLDHSSPPPWMIGPAVLRKSCAKAVQRLLALPVSTPSLRLLADETAKVMAGMTSAIDGLALLVHAPDQPRANRRGFWLSMADWLPALVNALRAFVTIGAVELFWVATAWPNGTAVIIFATAMLLLISPRGDIAYLGSIAATVGMICSIVCAAIIKFAVLPAFETFPAFCCVIGLFFIPAGFAIARSSSPAATAVFTPMAFTFVSLVAPTNQMVYDTTQFYNSALAILVGCALAPLAFSLLPPLSPALRTRRLLSLTLRDLHRMAVGAPAPSSEDWESRMYGRLAAIPDQAEPLQRAQLLAALSVGSDIIHLRRAIPWLGGAKELEEALKAFVGGHSATAIARLRQLDRRLTTAGSRAGGTLRLRCRILALNEALSRHAPYFDVGVTAWA